MPPNLAFCQRAIQSRTKVRAGPDLRAASGRTPVSSVEPGALNSGEFADPERDRGGGCLLVDRFRYRARLGRRRWVALATIAAVLGSVLAVGASAAGSGSQGPDLPSMGLAASDFAAGASVQTEGFTSPGSPAIAEYERLFRPGLRFGGYPILSAASTVSDFGDVGTATLVFDSARRVLNTRAGRRALFKALIASIPRRGRLKTSAAIAAPVSIAVGQGGFRILARFTLKSGSKTAWFELAFVLQRLDRALGALAFASYPGEHIPASVAVLAAQKVGSHFQSAFTIRNLTAPSVSGTAQQGQTLTANSGSWAGAPSGFTYQWARCDPTGANCAAIPGATAQTYVLGAADAGARISVTVTAANSVSTSSLVSVPTAPVS